MAFEQKTWTDRLTEYPTRRQLTKTDGSTEIVEVSRLEGTISQEGDAFSAENMNDLEQRIAVEFDRIESGEVSVYNKYTGNLDLSSETLETTHCFCRTISSLTTTHKDYDISGDFDKCDEVTFAMIDSDNSILDFKTYPIGVFKSGLELCLNYYSSTAYAIRIKYSTNTAISARYGNSKKTLKIIGWYKPEYVVV